MSFKPAHMLEYSHVKSDWSLAALTPMVPLPFHFKSRVLLGQSALGFTQCIVIHIIEQAQQTSAGFLSNEATPAPGAPL